MALAGIIALNDSATLSLIFFDQFSAEEGAPRGWGGLSIEPWIDRKGLPQETCLAGRINRRQQRKQRYGILLCFLGFLLFKIVVLNRRFVVSTKGTKDGKTDERDEH
jgi:hypothetical protein